MTQGMLNVTAKTSDVPPARTVAFTNNVITSTNIAVQENSVFTTTDSKYGKEHDTWGNDSNSVGLICGLIITGLVFAVASVAVVCKLRHIGPCKKTLVYKQKIEVKVINQESQLYQDERINVIKMTNTVANNVYGIANETRESVTTELTPSQTIQNNIYAIVMKSTEQANPENFLAEEYDQLNKPLTRVKTHNESQLYDVCLGSRDDADPVYNSSSNNKLTNRNIDMTYDLASTVVNKKQ